jgi:LmbE family N-acetylglucosaminyl deacetylase
VSSPLRILLASPAYWPAHAFGGPVVVARELVARLTRDGHEVDVVTTTLVDVGERPSRRTRVAQVIRQATYLTSITGDGDHADAARVLRSARARRRM